MQKTITNVKEEIGLQSWLRPDLTPVGRNQDYHLFRQQLEHIDRLMRAAWIEELAMDFALEGYEDASVKVKARRMEAGIRSVRIAVLGQLLGNPSYRRLAREIAGNDLLADFCRVRDLRGIHGVSKSAIERCAKFLRDEQLAMIHRTLLEMGGDPDRAPELGLAAPIDTTTILVDTTAIEANIHHPTDWVLLRDVARTLTKAIRLIREAGLRHRMPEEPADFAREMNRLCIAMTQRSRKPEWIRERKRILRQMKRLLRTIGEHAQRHRELLAAGYQDTEYTEAQASRILHRLDAMLAKLPTVIHQAHERIIGGRQIANEAKLLSVYEDDLHVLVRGKAGKQVEFGNTLFLAETAQGMIVDYDFHRGQAPAEWRQLDASLERQQHLDVPSEIGAVAADRGFSSKRGSHQLQKQEIYDAVCPRDPQQLARRMQEGDFSRLQRRRASTEARIAILKQRLGRLRNKGFTNRALCISWAIIAHNLWRFAVRLSEQEPIPRAA